MASFIQRANHRRESSLLHNLWYSAGKELSSYETHQEMDYNNFLSLEILGTVNFSCLRSCRVRSRPLVWMDQISYGREVEMNVGSENHKGHRKQI